MRALPTLSGGECNVTAKNLTDYVTSLSTQPSSEWKGRLLESAWLGVVLLTAVWLMSANYADPDLWGHVTYGQDALRDGLPATATYTYTAVGYRWINHENLAELAFATAANLGGGVGLMLLKTTVSALIVGMLFFMGQRVAPARLAAMGVLLVAGVLASRFLVRPQIFSYLFFTTNVLILEMAFAGGAALWNDKLASRRKPRLWLLVLLVPLFMVWTNTHGGFVAGLGITTVYLACRMFEIWSVFQWKKTRLLGWIALIAGSCLLATLVNPYGWKLQLWLLESLQIPRPEITEWAAPTLTNIFLWPFWITLALTVLALSTGSLRKHLTYIVVLMLIGMQAILHLRFAPFFAILAFVASLPQINRLMHTYLPNLTVDRPERWRGAWKASLAVACTASLLMLTLIGWQNRKVSVSMEKYPVAAVQFLADHNIQGRMVCEFGWAQYMIAALGAETADDPGIRLAFDGRFRTCYPQAVVDEYFDFAIGGDPPSGRHRRPDAPPVDPSAILHRDDPTLLLWKRSKSAKANPSAKTHTPLDHLDRNNWVLLYQDSLAELWGKRDVYDNPALATYISVDQRVIVPSTVAANLTKTQRGNSAAWPAFAQPQPKNDLLATQTREEPAS